MNKNKNNEKFLTLLKILKNYSNKENPLTRRDINIYMKNEGYDEIKDSRTINRYIDDLINLGYDIEIIEKNKNYKSYYLASREFESHEIKILSDCIYASKFITKKKSSELVKKIYSLSTIDCTYSIERNSYIDDRSKTINKEVFYNIDKINTAINDNKKICFHYYAYNEYK